VVASDGAAVAAIRKFADFLRMNLVLCVFCAFSFCLPSGRTTVADYLHRPACLSNKRLSFPAYHWRVLLHLCSDSLLKFLRAGLPFRLDTSAANHHCRGGGYGLDILPLPLFSCGILDT